MNLLVPVLLALTGPSGHSQTTTIQRHLHYPATSLASRWNGDTATVAVQGGMAETRPGWPDLPVVAERIDLPPGMRLRGVVPRAGQWSTLASSAKVRRVAAIQVAKDLLGRPLKGEPRTLPVSGGEPPTVELGYQGAMRGRNVAYVMVRPVRWSSATGKLERLDQVDLQLELEPDPAAHVVQRERIVPEWELSDVEAPAAATEPTIPKRAPQPFKPTQLPSVLGSPVAYVIVTSDALAPQFQRLADWKTQAGVPAVVRTLTNIRQEYQGTDDADRVRRFLRDAYSRWGTKWALIGGDTHVIPARVAWSKFYTLPNEPLNDIPTDLYYSCLDGNWNADGDSLYGEGDLLGPPPNGTTIDGADLLPEIWVGRAPVGTLAEAQQFVDKVFQYSRTPVGNYEKNILFFAEVMDPQDWTPGDFIYLDGAELVEECLPYVQMNPGMRYGRLYENYLDPNYQPGALQISRRRVVDSLNVGYNLAVHCGHGFRNVMSAGDSNITIADATGLTNGNKLTNFYAVDCTSNAIDFPCLGEAYMKAPNGGAVSSVGSTRVDFPSTGRVYQRDYFKLMFRDSVSAIGEAQGRQKLAWVPNSKTDNVHRWTQMTLILLGDPEMRMWTGKPRTLTVNRPASISANDTTFTVNVAISGVPLYGARVTAYKASDDYASVLTDGAGNARLDFRPDGSGTFTLTVTGYDCIPYQATVPVNATAAALLVESAITVDDDNVSGTVGNGDGIVDAGETVDLTIPIKNIGGTNAANVNGFLSTTNPVVTISNPGPASYGTIAASATVSNAAKYRLQTSYLAADQTEIAFTLSIFDGSNRRYQEPVRITLRAPELRSYAHTVAEDVGDQDGRPGPGESVSYTASVRNTGSGVARGVTAILRRLDSFSSVTDSTSTLGNISPGFTTLGDAFAFSVTDAAAKFELRLFTSQGLIGTQKIDLGWPATPQNLGGRGLATAVSLAWTANTEPDLAGYCVWRSANAGGPFQKVNSLPADRTAYSVNEGLTALTRYYYKVTAVDSSGNESDLSSTVAVSTTAPSHTVFPIAMAANATASVTVARLYGATSDLIAGSDQGLYVWHADGSSPVDADGNPLTSGDFSLLGSKYAAGASVADLDGGPLEIVAPTWNDQKVYVFDLQGNVKAGWPFNAGTAIWSTPAIGDLDKNGTKEIVFGANDNNYLYVLRSNGTEWMDGDANPATTGVFKVLGFNYNYGTPALADLDGDGFLDIVFSSKDGKLYAWNRNGTSLPGFPIQLDAGSNSSVAIGYLDGPGDSQLDIVAASGGSPGVPAGSLYAVRANGTLRAGFPVPGLLTGDGYGKEPSPALADINGDGFNDIVMASENGQLKVFDRNGVLFPAFTNVRFSTMTSAATESSPVVADINGDGFPDIVIGDDNSTLSAFDRNGQLLPGFPMLLGGEVRGTPALCDCDGDGKTEIVAAGFDGKMYVWDYDFTFSPGKTPPWPQFHHDAMHTGLAAAETAVSVPGPTLPKSLALAPPYPNPVRQRASLSYEIPTSSAGANFSVDVYDAAGRRVHRLAHGVAQPGRWDLQWDLRDARGALVGSGLYLLVLDVGGERRSRRVVALP